MYGKLIQEQLTENLDLLFPTKEFCPHRAKSEMTLLAKTEMLKKIVWG